jgi:OmpA-OmpF porin, OOP family
LDKIIDFLKEDTTINLNITGHTDSTGTAEYNQTLSEKRAYSVYQYLLDHGIYKTRLKHLGKGESEPLNESQLIKNLGLNRRVEFEFKNQKE